MIITRKTVFEAITNKINSATLASAKACDTGVFYARTVGVARVASATAKSAGFVARTCSAINEKANGLAKDRLASVITHIMTAVPTPVTPVVDNNDFVAYPQS